MYKRLKYELGLKYELLKYELGLMYIANGTGPRVSYCRAMLWQLGRD
jgi:hypothetical protein